MLIESKLAPLRKGLLEFLVLKIVGARSVYVLDILRRLSGTEFATQASSSQRLRERPCRRAAAPAASRVARYAIASRGRPPSSASTRRW